MVPINSVLNDLKLAMDALDKNQDMIFVFIAQGAHYDLIMESMEELPFSSGLSDVIDYRYGSIFGHSIVLSKAVESESRLYALPANLDRPITYKHYPYTRHISEI